ncbi:Protein of unknown function [Caloramator quimbayensis]|uniref:DUF1659 domain-containing protein n=1 Tax=Caloramator quimbayensis TaxID=1147123 RepID=A0A1T4WGA1_9CLOT|nr:DUF1659 domain-containing protein [Caloramator quimbayensis]SKA75681.1 Protein of unknown function [Caloramator quimbayensis]
MAVNGVKVSSNLVLRVRTGVDQNGNDTFDTTTLRKIKTSSSDQDLFDVAQSIGTLLKNPIDAVLRQDVNELVNQ